MQTFCNYIGYLVIALIVGLVFASLAGIFSVKVMEFSREEGFTVFRCVWDIVGIGTCAYLAMNFED